jgi:hypothetical protein
MNLTPGTNQTTKCSPATRSPQPNAGSPQKDIYDVKFECNHMDGPTTINLAGKGYNLLLMEYCAAEFYQNGIKGVLKDVSAAKRYHHLSADGGFAAAQVAVGDEYWPGDYAQAMACIEKDPKRRLQAIGEARIAVEDAVGAEPAGPALQPAFTPPCGAHSPRTPRRAAVRARRSRMQRSPAKCSTTTLRPRVAGLRLAPCSN